MKKGLIVIVLMLMLFISVFSVELVNDYRGIKKFEYKVTSPDEIFYYGAEINSAGGENEVKTWTTKRFPADIELSESEVLSASVGSSFMILMNPIYTQILTSLDMESMSLGFFFGFDIKDEGMEQVGRWVGKKVALMQGGEKILSWVISEEIGMVLKTEMYEDNITIELVDFVK